LQVAKPAKTHAVQMQPAAIPHTVKPQTT